MPINFDNAKHANAPMVPGSVVTLSCNAAEVKFSTAGNLMLLLQLVVEEVKSRPDVSDDVTALWIGRKITHRCMFTDTSYVYSYPVFEAFNVPWPTGTLDDAQLETFIRQTAAPAFKGKLVTAKTKHSKEQLNIETGEPYPIRDELYGFKPFNVPVVAMPDRSKRSKKIVDLAEDDLF